MAKRGVAINMYSAFTDRGATRDATKKFQIPITDVSFQVQRNPMSEKSTSVSGEPVIYGGTYGCSGSFGGVYRGSDNGIWYCMRSMLGRDPNLGGVDTPATHASFWFDITVQDELGGVNTFSSGIITSMEISARAGDFAKYTFNWVGGMECNNDSGAFPSHIEISDATYTTKAPIFYNIFLTSGATAYKCTGFTMKINRPFAADDFCIGSEYTQSIVQSDNLTIDGSLTLAQNEAGLFSVVTTTGDLSDPGGTDPTWNTLGYLKTNTLDISASKSLTIAFADPDGGATGLGGIILHDVKLTDASKSASGRQRFEKSVNFRAATTNTSGIKITTSGGAPT